jgi:hypothetical protein
MDNPDTTTRNSLAIRVFRIDVSDADKPIVDREWAALLDPKPGKVAALRQGLGAVAGRPRQAPDRGARRHGLQRSERLDEDLGVTPGAKALCIDVDAALTANGLVNQKLEGISVVKVGGKSVLAAVDDNDFDLAHITHPADNPSSLPTTVDFVPLPAGCS